MSIIGCRQKNKLTKEEIVTSNMKDLFSLSNLKYDIDYTVYNIPLKTIPGYLHTLEAGFNNKETLVMIHGYGGNIGFYYQMLPFLKEHFHVYAFDMYGMGNSYRYDFNLKSHQEAIDLYTKSIEEWRQECKIDNFYLLGHSMGAYVTNYYLHKYQPNVRGVFMVSPAGLNNISEEEQNEWRKKMKMGCIRKQMGSLLFYLIHEWQWSPFSFLTIAPTNKILKRYFGAERLRLSEHEQEFLIRYYKSILDLKSSGERVLGLFLKYGRYSNNPFGELQGELMKKYRYVFLYGDRDWMDVTRDRIKLDSQKEEFGGELKYEGVAIVEDCGHQMPFENSMAQNKCIKEYYGVFEEKNRLNVKL